MSRDPTEQAAACSEAASPQQEQTAKDTLPGTAYTRHSSCLGTVRSVKLSSLKLAKGLVDLESLISTYLALFVLGGLLLMPDLDKFKERW